MFEESKQVQAVERTPGAVQVLPGLGVSRLVSSDIGMMLSCVDDYGYAM